MSKGLILRFLAPGWEVRNARDVSGGSVDDGSCEEGVGEEGVCGDRMARSWEIVEAFLAWVERRRRFSLRVSWRVRRRVRRESGVRVEAEGEGGKVRP